MTNAKTRSDDVFYFSGYKICSSLFSFLFVFVYCLLLSISLLFQSRQTSWHCNWKKPSPTVFLAPARLEPSLSLSLPLSPSLRRLWPGHLCRWARPVTRGEIIFTDWQGSRRRDRLYLSSSNWTDSSDSSTNRRISRSDRHPAAICWRCHVCGRRLPTNRLWAVYNLEYAVMRFP